MDTGDQVFAGLKFWLAQRVPSRSHFIDQIRVSSSSLSSLARLMTREQKYGGSVEPLEKNASIKIADHARKEQIPGT